MNRLITVKYVSVNENLACSLMPWIPNQTIQNYSLIWEIW